VIVLDTNVISALMAPVQEPVVVGWFASVAPASVFTTAVTRAEILYGIRILPEGRRKAGLDANVAKIFDARLSGRVLSFDTPAADAYANIVALRRALGRPMLQFDAQIAAIAISRGASIATRNVRDFEHIGLDIINPWDFKA
jgi:predicted nucleic acid-binding protein